MDQELTDVRDSLGSYSDATIASMADDLADFKAQLAAATTQEEKDQILANWKETLQNNYKTTEQEQVEKELEEKRAEWIEFIKTDRSQISADDIRTEYIEKMKTAKTRMEMVNIIRDFSAAMDDVESRLEITQEDFDDLKNNTLASLTGGYEETKELFSVGIREEILDLYEKYIEEMTNTTIQTGMTKGDMTKLCDKMLDDIYQLKASKKHIRAELLDAGNTVGTITDELLNSTDMQNALASYAAKMAAAETVEQKNGIIDEWKTFVKKNFMNDDKKDEGSMYADVPDVPGWRYDAIKYVTDHGIMNGISGTRNFAPDDSLTRAMFATIIYRMEGSPKASYSAKFPDVPDGNYFSVPILWANKVGIINGHSNTGLFGTRENITREDMVVIMYRYCKYKGIADNGRADLSSFPDAGQVSGYAKEAVQWAVANGIIKGRSNTGVLDPKGNASRVETAAIIQRFMNKIK